MTRKPRGRKLVCVCNLCVAEIAFEWAFVSLMKPQRCFFCATQGMSTVSLRLPALRRWCRNNAQHLLRVVAQVRHTVGGSTTHMTPRKLGSWPAARRTLIVLQAVVKNGVGETEKEHSTQLLLRGVHYLLALTDLTRLTVVDTRGRARWLHPEFQLVCAATIASVGFLIVALQRGVLPVEDLVYFASKHAKPLVDLMLAFCVLAKCAQTGTPQLALTIFRNCCHGQGYLGVLQLCLHTSRTRSLYLWRVGARDHFFLLQVRFFSVQVALALLSHFLPPPAITPKLAARTLHVCLHAIAVAFRRYMPASNGDSQSSRFEREILFDLLRGPVHRKFECLATEAVECLDALAVMRRHLSEISWSSYDPNLQKSFAAASLIVVRRIQFGNGIDGAQAGLILEDFLTLWCRSFLVFRTSRQVLLQLLQDDVYYASFRDTILTRLFPALGWDHYETEPEAAFLSRLANTDRSTVCQGSRPLFRFYKIVELLGIVTIGRLFNRPFATRWVILAARSVALLASRAHIQTSELQSKTLRFLKTVRCLTGVSVLTTVAAMPLIDQLRCYFVARPNDATRYANLLLQIAMNVINRLIVEARTEKNDLQPKDVVVWSFVEEVVSPAVLHRMRHAEDNAQRIVDWRELTGHVVCEAQSLQRVRRALRWCLVRFRVEVSRAKHQYSSNAQQPLPFPVATRRLWALVT